MIGGILNLRLELVRQSILRQYRMHLSIVLTRFAKYIHHMSERNSRPLLPAINHCRHLHPRATSQLIGIRYRYIIRHEPAFYKHPRLMTDHVQDSDERSHVSFHNLNNLSFTPLVRLFARHRHTYNIAMKCSHSMRLRHKDIVFITIAYHKYKTVPGHLHLACHHRENLLFLPAATPTGRLLSSAHITFLKSHKFMKYLTK